MAGFFDPSMFPNAMASGAPQMGLLARLANMISTPTGMSGSLPPMPPPGADAMAQGMIPPQGAPAPQSAPPMSQPPGLPSMAPGSATLAGMFGNSDGSGFLNGLHNFIGQHQNALAGLGAGIASGGLQRGVGGMAQGGQMDYQRQMQMNALQGTYQALQGAGLPEPVARAAALNPEVLKAVAPSLYARQQLTDLGTDPLTGMKRPATYNPITGELTAISPSGGTPGGGTTSDQLFNQISDARQKGASQQDLIQMLPPSLQEGVAAMIQGRAVPANLSMRGAARDLTIRLAQEVDPTFDQTKIPERVKFATQMAETTPNSAGGQKQLLNTSLQHLAELSDHLVDLHNSNLSAISSIPGSGYLANGYNAVANSSANMSGAKNAVNIAAQNASGEIGKLYSGATGGGEREREATASRFSTNNPPEASASGLETTRSMVLDKLNSLQNQRDQVYGKSGEGIYPLVDPQTKAALDKIDANIAKLRGQANGSTSSPTQATKPAPAVGTVEQGHRFLGGDPSNPKSWVSVQ
jgi:hypothetical protein